MLSDDRHKMHEHSMTAILHESKVGFERLLVWGACSILRPYMQQRHPLCYVLPIISLSQRSSTGHMQILLINMQSGRDFKEISKASESGKQRCGG